MLEFSLKNNYFEFNREVKEQLLGAAIGTKCEPPYAFIFMDNVETGFLESQKHKLMVWFCYIDETFFIWTHGEKELEQFLKEPNKTHPNVKITDESNKKFYTDLHMKATVCHQYLQYIPFHPGHTKKSRV